MKGGGFQTDSQSVQEHHPELGLSMNDTGFTAETISPTRQIGSGFGCYASVGPKHRKPVKEIRPGMETEEVVRPPWSNMLALPSWCTSCEDIHFTSQQVPQAFEEDGGTYDSGGLPVKYRVSARTPTGSVQVLYRLSWVSANKRQIPVVRRPAGCPARRLRSSYPTPRCPAGRSQNI